MPAKGRTPVNPPRRRPRVAGHGHNRPATAPGAEPADERLEPLDEQPVAAPAAPAEEPAAPAEEPADEFHDEPPDQPTSEPAGPAVEANRSRRAWVQLVLLVLVIVVLGTLAAVFRGQAERASTGAARNQAVIDTGANTEVVGQVSKAIETVLSYDHTRLDENEKAAREVITGEYVDEYDKTFADIRKSATEQKVVLKTTVLLAGVKQLGADRAELIATMNLDSVKDGAPVSAPGRVTVVATRVDGRWKIAQVDLV